MTSTQSGLLRHVRRKQTSNSCTDVIAVNLGIGSIHIVLLGDAENGQVLLKDYRSIEIDPRISGETTKMAALLKKELKPFIRASKHAEIWTTPYLDETSFYNIRIPLVKSSRLPGAVHWALQRKESFIENETIVDFKVNEQTSTKSVIDLSCALSVRSPIEDLKQIFDKAGLSLAGIGMPPFSLCRLLGGEGKDRENAPVLMIEMGFKFTSATVIANGHIVFTRNIPIGVLNLMEALNREFDSSPSKQEALQLILEPEREDGLSPEIARQGALVAPLIQRNLERLIRQVESTVEYYQTKSETLPIQAIFLSGEIAARSHLVKFLSKRLSLKTEAINPFKTLDFHQESPVPEDEKGQIRLGPACGLAIEARTPAINFAYTYKDQQVESNTRKYAAFSTIILILLAVSFTVLYRSKQKELQKLESDKATLEAQVSTMGMPITEEAIVKETSMMVELQTQRQEAIKRYRSLAFLTEVSRETPKNIAILNLSALLNGSIRNSSEDTKDKSAEDRPVDLQLKGLVSGKRAELETSLTIYVARLRKSLLFEKVKVVEKNLVNTAKGPGLTFTLNVYTKQKPKEDL
ncbi:pilus assembly protein PilM [Akkermansiaceae bacterium]|nr:pilus assembly protein PilM [Akkermansiaceae bacterium]MDB4541830.1 pilus assembly protein PilM [bacterium]MDB4566595.1 pilus assembly protein PilM [Akkermansiaceae bacterium]MDB4572471.1 pilus assembly protein PilM [Akkermansiaceae bacterium]